MPTGLNTELTAIPMYITAVTPIRKYPVLLVSSPVGPLTKSTAEFMRKDCV